MSITTYSKILDDDEAITKGTNYNTTSTFYDDQENDSDEDDSDEKDEMGVKKGVESRLVEFYKKIEENKNSEQPISNYILPEELFVVIEENTKKYLRKHFVDVKEDGITQFNILSTDKEFDKYKNIMIKKGNFYKYFDNCFDKLVFYVNIYDKDTRKIIYDNSKNPYNVYCIYHIADNPNIEKKQTSNGSNKLKICHMKFPENTYSTIDIAFDIREFGVNKNETSKPKFPNDCYLIYGATITKGRFANNRERDRIVFEITYEPTIKKQCFGIFYFIIGSNIFYLPYLFEVIDKKIIKKENNMDFLKKNKLKARNQLPMLNTIKPFSTNVNFSDNRNNNAKKKRRNNKRNKRKKMKKMVNELCLNDSISVDNNDNINDEKKTKKLIKLLKKLLKLLKLN